MSQLADIRAAILEALRTVPDLGNVHGFERHTSRGEAKFRELYVAELGDGSKQLRGWWLRRNATSESTDSIGIGSDALSVHTWQLRGYMALSDEQQTELTFDELIEAIRDKVREDQTFGGVANQGPYNDGDNTDGAQLLDSGPVMFCGVLCHSALIEFRTWSYQ